MAALPPDFVDGLYRKVLMSVKASNAIPSEEEDFNFQSKFNKDFRAGAEDLQGRLTSLLHRLRHANVTQHGKNDADDDILEFDPLEENGPLTDLVDSLLEKASEQIIRFQKGEVDPTPAAAPPVTLPTATSTSNAATVSARPQDTFEDKIDNADTPFVSKLRAKLHAAPVPGDDTNEDDDELYHPYRNEITNLKYPAWMLQPDDVRREIIPLDDATYTYVDTPAALDAMVAALQTADLLAVDLENHSYHSFQGFLCLMQISTWDCDWLVDTLALRSHLHVLNTIFCNPAKLKVLHGADSDIVWLQRDLGLYVVNMFDTGQAARCLQYARFSLAHLLSTHCGVTADKQYQLADWRVRPLDEHLVKYAREDTRYLLYIYQVMKAELLAKPEENLLAAVLSRSQTLCLSVYEKPKAPTADDAAHVAFKLKSTVGLQTVTDSQLRVMEQLLVWRDRLARKVDESAGYVCPNAVLMKIMKGRPATPAQLFRLCNPIPPLVRKHAHELTVLLGREQDDEVAPTAAPHVVKPLEKTLVHATTEESSQLYAFKGWQVAAPRKATASNAAATGLFAAATGDGDDALTQQALLEQVRQAFASKEFVLVELAVDAVTLAAPSVVTKAEPVKEDAPAPLALSEKYPKLMKKRKADKAPSTAVDDDETSTAADGEATSSAAASFQPFDYAAQTLAATTMNLDEKPVVERNKRKKGYNPFVAAPDDSGMAPINQKRGYNAPRSSTTR
ncbi:Aste57867_4071 [Aphanomyces stellatus]|uniref:Aste57867_4071 protein n=1 Tax=Aphanomyces stellatus TaxID=120398 RepID=A0A485KC24_9STRA|nr:hypothetical protein As57867_004060 [Aphanomyces stellatus]VFT81205.1 Aste57867_4071 [Aphanomyces stellatus]